MRNFRLISGAATADAHRGPALKTLIKQEQKASKASKWTGKEDQAAHHELFLNTLKVSPMQMRGVGLA